MLQDLTAKVGSPLFRAHSVDLGVETIRVPVAEIDGGHPGKTLLVTAGMDGDEYAGMEAAVKLAEHFQNEAFNGKLIIVPIVNWPGFEAHVSENPLDKKYPKEIFQGRTRGSATERLIHWLTTTFAIQSDAWHDLHGGAHDEHLNPFLWLFRTRVPDVDLLTEKLIQATSTKTILHERAGLFSKQQKLAKHGCWFVMAESGELGTTEDVDVDRHVTWVKETMSVLDMLPNLNVPAGTYRPMNIFTRVKQKTRLHPGDESRLLWWKDGGPYFVSL